RAAPVGPLAPVEVVRLALLSRLHTLILIHYQRADSPLPCARLVPPGHYTCGSSVPWRRAGPPFGERPIDLAPAGPLSLFFPRDLASVVPYALRSHRARRRTSRAIIEKLPWRQESSREASFFHEVAQPAVRCPGGRGVARRRVGLLPGDAGA